MEGGVVGDSVTSVEREEENMLIDLPLCGLRFTWFKGDGVSMNRIDRFLLSEEWCLRWPNSLQIGLLCGVSDHCPLQLSVDEENWGPHPTRVLKCWQDMSGYKQFVVEVVLWDTKGVAKA
ncbi:hypothetical protein MTR_7g107070 [Medicago truncatula]|uniref:Endonuclease/exonuclease/phosphatase family protein n=1 Tax=Medicago truncatula TaxID=3880 RepID=A0A072U4N0_MEDTR|nr:hypothetical protein MTR_7g107070 [Medicago truncatula]